MSTHEGAWDKVRDLTDHNGWEAVQEARREDRIRRAEAGRETFVELRLLVIKGRQALREARGAIVELEDGLVSCLLAAEKVLEEHEKASL